MVVFSVGRWRRVRGFRLARFAHTWAVLPLAEPLANRMPGRVQPIGGVARYPSFFTHTGGLFWDGIKGMVSRDHEKKLKTAVYRYFGEGALRIFNTII